MIVLYNGRLVIERKKLSKNWHAIYKVPNTEERTIDLCTNNVQQAFITAQYNYFAIRDNKTYEEVAESFVGKLKCWSCIHWLARTNECSFGFPEAMQARGQYAQRCGLYDDCVKVKNDLPFWYLPAA
jgi:hypothetical protein